MIAFLDLVTISLFFEICDWFRCTASKISISVFSPISVGTLRKMSISPAGQDVSALITAPPAMISPGMSTAQKVFMKI